MQVTQRYRITIGALVMIAVAYEQLAPQRPLAATARTVPNAYASATVSAEDLAFTTASHTDPTCSGAISALRVSDGLKVFSGNYGSALLTELASGPNLSLVVAVGMTGSSSPFRQPLALLSRALTVAGMWQANGSQDERLQPIYVARRDPRSWDRWEIMNTVIGAEAAYRGIAVLPDGDSLLVSTSRYAPVSRNGNTPIIQGPYRLERYSVREIELDETLGLHRLGTRHGAIDLPGPVGKVLVDKDGSTAHLLVHLNGGQSDAMAIHSVDTESMTEKAKPIALEPMQFVPMRPLGTHRSGHVDADLSPDGRHIVTTRGLLPELNIVDLSTRTNLSIRVPFNQVGIFALSFSHGPHNIGRLALGMGLPSPSARPSERTPEGWLMQLVVVEVVSDRVVPITDIRSTDSTARGWADVSPLQAVAWLGDGSGLLWQGDTGTSAVALDVYRLADDLKSLVQKGRLMPCVFTGESLANYRVTDILTGNGYLQTPSPSPTPTTPPSPTPPNLLNPTTTPFPTDSPSATAAPTDTPTPPASATPTPSRSALYLPALLGEVCWRKRAVDVVLVLDLSSSMLGEDRSGRSKLSAAKEAALSLVGQLRLGGGEPGSDRLAVVAFNADAWIEQGLSEDQQVVEAAIRGLDARVSQGTRLDLALEQGRLALEAGASGGGREGIVVLLTDGMPSQVPTPSPAGSSEDTILRAASALRTGGRRLFTVGLGQADAVEERERIHRALLIAIAGREDRYFETPHADELVAIYEQIATAIGCRQQ